MDKFAHGGDVFSYPDVRLDFSVNLNPLGMPEAVRRAVADGAAGFDAYPDPRCRALCEAIAQSEGVDAEDILCGAGAADLIIRLALALRPRRTLLCAPTFSEYEKAARIAGSGVLYHDLREADGFAVTERLLADVTRLRPELLFICNPNNPTGTLLDETLLCRLAALCQKAGTVLAVDECFLPFTTGASALPLLSEHSNIVILRAFTKLCSMAGLRLGYMITKNHMLLGLTEAAGQSWSVSAPAQAAGLAALGCEGLAERTRGLVAAEREWLTKELRAAGVYVFDSRANFLLLKTEPSLFAPLLRHGLLVRSCANYRGLDDRFVRVGIKMRSDNETLVKAVAEIMGKARG